MTDAGELAAAIAALARAFDALGVTWAIGGSIASVFHGEPRATNDIDVVALLDASGATSSRCCASPPLSTKAISTT